MTEPTATADAKRENMMRKVRALLDRADHPTTPAAEADACRAKADKLMLDYSIEEWHLRDAAPVRVKPEMRTMTVCDYENPFRSEYENLVWYLALHVKAKGVFSSLRTTVPDESYAGGERTVVMRVFKAVAFPSDLDYIEMVFVGLRLAFGNHVEPKYDPAIGYDANVSVMHEAGLKWERIAELTGTPWPDGLKLRRAYYRQCKLEGREPTRIHSPERYRSNFASAFTGRIWSRLYRMRDASGRDSGEPGTALVLRDRAAEVEEEFYNLFPNLRPDPTPAAEVVKAEPCPKCAKAKSGRCREHWVYATGGKSVAFDAAADMAGRRAADNADLSGGRNHLRQTRRIEA